METWCEFDVIGLVIVWLGFVIVLMNVWVWLRFVTFFDQPSTCQVFNQVPAPWSYCSVLWDNPLSTWNLFQRFYRYHEFLYEKEQQTKRKQSVNAVPYTPYCTILKQCLPQCFNVFFVFFVTLTIFPAVHSGELQALSTFMVNENHFIFCSRSVRYIKWDILNTGWKIDLYIVLIGRYILKCLLDYQT